MYVIWSLFIHLYDVVYVVIDMVEIGSTAHVGKTIAHS